MAPNQNYSINSAPLEPVSRTYQYRKVMKPLLERKRRARINRCLDELKELMTNAFQAEGENVAKLEKADILELTVRHLHSLRDKNSLFIRNDVNHIDRFWDGFRQCAGEVSQFLSKFDNKIGVDLINHINEGYAKNLENVQQIIVPPTNRFQIQRITQSENLFYSNSYRLQSTRCILPNELPQHTGQYGYFQTKNQSMVISGGGINNMVNESNGDVWRPW